MAPDLPLLRRGAASPSTLDRVVQRPAASQVAGLSQPHRVPGSTTGRGGLMAGEHYTIYESPLVTHALTTCALARYLEFIAPRRSSVCNAAFLTHARFSSVPSNSVFIA